VSRFITKVLPICVDAVAPDGSDVRLLCALEGGGMAHFQLGPQQISTAVKHRTVEEIWYFLSGEGEMWRQQGEHTEVVNVRPGTSITIPVGTSFQFRATTSEPLTAVGVTMPPWPGDGEAMLVPGFWTRTVPARTAQEVRVGRPSTR
jgi:mannose-6-phosphate isomerase-like protein (cupin superfamily)